MTELDSTSYEKDEIPQPSSLNPSGSTEESDIICQDSSTANNEKLAEPQQSVASATITFSKTPKRSMEPIRKFVNVCGCALTIMTGFIMVLNMIRSYALTAPMHLDTVHTTLSTELQKARKTNATHSIQYDLATGRSQKRSLMSTMHQKFTDYNINS